MPKTELIHLRPDDAERVIPLTYEVGWNQPPVLWEQLLGWAGEGGMGLTLDDELVGAGLVVCYPGERAWIGGMITSPEHQRQGLGTRLMTVMMDHARAQGCGEILLDSSAEGSKLYTNLGFHPLYDVEVRVATGPAVESVSGSPIRPFQAADLPGIVALDAETFGVERGWLIEQLVNEYSESVWVDGPSEAIQGFACAGFLEERARIGPLTHVDAEGAGALLRAALGPLAGKPVVLAVSTDNPAAVALADKFGFEPRTSARRMIHSEARVLQERSDNSYAILSVATG